MLRLWWTLSLVLVAGSARAGPPLVAADPGASLLTGFNVDLAGDGSGALIPAAGWAALADAEIPGFRPAPQGNDAVALHSAQHPKGPRKVDVALNGRVLPETTLLATYVGRADAGAALLRITWTGVDGVASTIDLGAGQEIFPLEGGGSSEASRAVPVGSGKALSLVRLVDPRGSRPLATLTLESRTGLDTYLLALLPGDVTALPRVAAAAPPRGFPFPIALNSPPPPLPEAWRVAGPTGGHGRLGVRDGHLAFADGTRARFWGINLLNAACYPTHDQADALAAHLSGNGFNLVRLHHCDGEKSGGINPARTGPENLLLADGMDRFDYLVSRLEAAGVYLLLEVATNRTFSAADGVNHPGPDVPNGHKLLPAFEPDWHQAYLDWAAVWLGRTNGYTHLRYADDPGVAMVELANEHSLFVSWLTGGVERLSLPHRDQLTARWNAFLSARYPNDAALNAAWIGSINPGLRPGETLGSLQRLPSGQGTFNQWPDARVGDLYDFYLGLDEAFYADVSGAVRALGFTQPLVPGVTFDQPAVAQTFARYDVIDNHLEWDSPAGGQQRNDSMVANPRSQNLLDKLHIAQFGKPMMVSEMSHGFPNDHGAEVPIFMASIAALQDWDAIVWLNYTNGPIPEGAAAVTGPTEIQFAANKWVQMGVASGLFRSGAIAPASGLVPLWRSREQVRAETVLGGRPPLQLLRDVSTALSSRIRESYDPVPPAPVRGTPGQQVGWYPEAGRFVVQTAVAEAVLADPRESFRLPGSEGSGPDRASHLESLLGDEAAVSLVCLDGALDTCREGLLTVAGRMENLGMERIAGGTIALDQGADGVWVHAPGGSVSLRWPSKPEVRPIAVDGALGAPLPVSAEPGRWMVQLGETPARSFRVTTAEAGKKSR